MFPHHFKEVFIYSKTIILLIYLLVKKNNVLFQLKNRIFLLPLFFETVGSLQKNKMCTKILFMQNKELLFIIIIIITKIMITNHSIHHF